MQDAIRFEVWSAKRCSHFNRSRNFDLFLHKRDLKKNRSIADEFAILGIIVLLSESVLLRRICKANGINYDYTKKKEKTHAANEFNSLNTQFIISLLV